MMIVDNICWSGSGGAIGVHINYNQPAHQVIVRLVPVCVLVYCCRCRLCAETVKFFKSTNEYLLELKYQPNTRRWSWLKYNLKLVTNNTSQVELSDVSLSFGTTDKIILKFQWVSLRWDVSVVIGTRSKHKNLSY